MRFFLDTVDIEALASLVETGLIDGVTTNPSIMAQSPRPQRKVILDICSLVKGPVSVEVIATDYTEIVREAHDLADLASNVVIKVPVTF
ncbi:MAG: fructose-6-phosphate aldolase, partial [Holosporales bacterium]|nr:fructose-6-phosphate aldolase [Holosporales bacterium]